MSDSTPSRARTALAALLLFVTALALSAAILEVGVRTFLGTQVKFPRHVVGAPWGLRINEPGAVYRHHSPDVLIWFRINAQGMRADRDYAYEKPPGVQRIVSLGDSFTAGYEVEGNETFSAVLERELNQRGRRVEVLNAGVSGFSNAEALLYLERELWRYEPDVVLLSFFVNDIVDNVRTGLFTLEDGALVPRAESYVPAGAIGNFLNTNFVFNLLSERSDAFALLKEKATLLLKRRMVQENLQNVTGAAAAAAKPPGEGSAEAPYDQRLTVAILDAIAASCRARGVPFVLQSIPYEIPATKELVDGLPRGFDTTQEGVHVLRAAEVLAPYVGREPLYYPRSHYHWTPLSHRLSGEALAALIEDNALLD